MMDWVEKLKLLVDNKLESFSKQGREVKEEIERLREGLREQKRSEGRRVESLLETIKGLERKIEGLGKWVAEGERRKGKRRRRRVMRG